MSKYRITLEGKVYEMEVELVKEEAAPQPVGKSQYKEFKGAVKDPTVRVIDPAAEKQTVNETGTVVSPMPGTVIEIMKTAGQSVKAGEVVLILEAMKMENEIFAKEGGTVKSVDAPQGASVNSGDVIITLG